MIWYFEYLKLIREGKPISKLTAKALDRIPKYLNKFEFNGAYPNALIKFIETFIYPQKGDSGKGEPLHLQIEQKFWIELFGFIDPHTKRPVISDIPLILGAGSGKSTFMAALAIAVMVVDSKKGNDVLILSNSVEQSQATFRTAADMVTDEKSLLFNLSQKEVLKPIINKIKYYPTNSQIEVKTMDNRTADGVNVRMAIFDEIHSYTTNVIENIRKSAAPKRADTGFTMFYISTNGQTRGAVFDEYFKFWTQVLDGSVEDYSTFPIIYQMDDVSEVKDINLYPKAMPFVNEISDPQIIYDNLKKVSGNPAGQAEILAKSFNLPQQQYNALFTTKQLQSAFDLKIEELSNEVAVGWDMSAINDMSAVSIVKRNSKGQYEVINQAFIPEFTFNNLTTREQRLRYVKFVSEGSLKLVKSKTIEQEFVYDWITRYLNDNNLTPVIFAGDAYYSKVLRKAIISNWGEELVKTVNQSVAGLSEPTKYLKAKIEADEMAIRSELTRWALSNLRVKIDANNNIYPNKKQAVDKIDPAIAIISAISGLLDYDYSVDFSGWS